MFQVVLFVTLVVKLSQASEGIEESCEQFKDSVFDIGIGTRKLQRLHGDCKTMMLFENITLLNISCPTTRLEQVTPPAMCYMDHMVNIRYVFINGCGIRDLIPLIPDIYYQFVSCSNIKMEIFDLSRNRIDAIYPGVFNQLKSIQRINLNDNRISVITSGAFSNMDKLEILDLSSNRLKLIKREWFTYTRQMKALYLSNNFIEEIPSNLFKNWPKLAYLYLHHNTIRTIHSGAFIHVTNLTYLDLSFNSITNLHSDMFSPLSKFNILDITANYFNVLTKDFLSGLDVDLLRISRNPFKCSCYNEMLTTIANAPNILCYDAVQAPIPHCWTPSYSPNYCPSPEHVDNNMTEMFVAYLKRCDFYQYYSNPIFFFNDFSSDPSNDPYTIVKCKYD